MTNAGLKVKFTTTQVWIDLRDNWPKVNWNEVVWFKQLIPKHSFILWLAVQGKLLTQDRMVNWNVTGNLVCGLCNSRSDSHEHLFFQCPFANKVWKVMGKMASNLNTNDDLMDCCNYIADKQIKNNFEWVIDKVIMAATVYFIWQERNFRLFKGESRSEEVLVKCIKESVKNKLLTLCVKRSMKAQLLAKKWGLTWNSKRLFVAG